ncbi:DNA ligase D [Tahibacter sp.]|uniref:DNA ligase D n=1 Tax=Tahibacter sp. TaxID=2056211 RepID=UPI0028C3B579|nr:DNA ligase D [Tahibacter sp.]
MSLTAYQRKRDFSRTREPAPRAGAAAGQRSLFVVQLHHASRRHYDFRLQVGDTLKSWAVPKGPSFDPAVKRLAAEVEDHPLDYADFEGEIPAGEYGGGHVALFDRGVWTCDGDVEAQLRKGHLQFELFGERLKGGWHLVRTRRGRSGHPEWLLIKQHDAYAGQREADDLLAGVTRPPAATGPASKTAAKKSAKRVATARKSPARSGARSAPQPRRGRRIDWAVRAAALPAARRGALADAPFEPQLAQLATQPPAGDGWLHELKWDGYRLLAVIRGGTARLWSRNAIEWTAKLPDIVAALERLGVEQAALDGELIAGNGAHQDFALLQSTLSGQAQARLSYVLFDLIHLDGIDLRASPLHARKELLAQWLGKPPARLAYSSHIAGDGAAAFELATARDFEGTIAKRADAPYRSGRSDDWRKIKRAHSDEYAVVGYTAPRGSRSGFGSLLLARHVDGAWQFAGRVGSGFDDAQMRQIAAALPEKTSATPSVPVEAIDTDLRTARWFAPAFVVEVFSRGQGRQGLLRQPSLKAIRMDKNLRDLRSDAPTARTRNTKGAAPKKKPVSAARETSPGKPVPVATATPARKKTARAVATTAPKKSAANKPATNKPEKKSAPGKSAAEKSASAKAAPKKSTRAATKAPAAKPARKPTAAAPRLTSPERVVFPDDDIRKQDVADYYRAVAPLLLREIAGRPVSVVRCPDGIGQACFFQKHRTAGITQVDRVRLKEESGATRDYLVVNDETQLMELVQFNALEFHPWGSTAARPDRADRLVFDLDPGPGVTWAAVKSAARQLHDLLAKTGLESFLRTSGGKGLHVVVPLNPGCSWNLVKRFAQGFAASLAQSEPERYVAVASKAKRNGVIFIDYLRNGRGATSVASYSLRARPGAPVAMPLAWSELARLKSAAAFDLHSARRRIARRAQDPWSGIDEVHQNLARWAD